MRSQGKPNFPHDDQDTTHMASSLLRTIKALAAMKKERHNAVKMRIEYRQDQEEYGWLDKVITIMDERIERLAKYAQREADRIT